MLLWVWLLGGVSLVLSTGGLMLAMARAERRARRSLYLSLGLAETTVEFLMARNRDVLTELTYVRHEGEAAVGETAAAFVRRDRNVVFLRPAARSVPDAPNPTRRGVDHPPPTSDGHTRH